jgi:hypothetical protein
MGTMESSRSADTAGSGVTDMVIKLLKLLCMAMALGFVGWQLRQYLLGQASVRWRTVKGKVLRVSVDEHVSHDRYGNEHCSYSANVEYSYHVGSRHFDSKHLTYEPTTGLSESAATQLLAGITEGADVDVHYDAHDFEHAVLIAGTSGGNIVHMALSFLVLAGVTWMCFFAEFGPSH